MSTITSASLYIFSREYIQCMLLNAVGRKQSFLQEYWHRQRTSRPLLVDSPPWRRYAPNRRRDLGFLLLKTIRLARLLHNSCASLSKWKMMLEEAMFFFFSDTVFISLLFDTNCSFYWRTQNDDEDRSQENDELRRLWVYIVLLDIRRDCGAVIRCVWDGSDLAFSSRRLNFWWDVVLTRSWINSFHCEQESLLCPVSEVRVYDVQSAHVSRRGQTFCMCGQPTMMWCISHQGDCFPISTRLRNNQLVV
jgi:hypothetical protein